MTTNLNHPLIVDFVGGKGNVIMQNGKMIVPAFSTKVDTLNSLKNALTEASQNGQPYDYIAVNYNAVQNENYHPNEATMSAINMRTNWMLNLDKNGDKAMGQDVLPVINRLNGSNQLYLLNPQWNKEAKGYTLPDGKVGEAYVAPTRMVKQLRQSYESQGAWDEHQSQVLNRFRPLFPLSELHKQELTAPKRGLEEKDLGQFFDWKPNKPVIPGLMGDNMLGIPSIKSTIFDGVKVTADGIPIGTGTLLALKTGGVNGIMLHMTNEFGDTPKYQVAADLSMINCYLKAKAADGLTVQKAGYWKKNTGQYLFKMKDGSDAKLRLAKVDPANKTATFTDKEGEFTAKLGEDVKSVLDERGYDLPPIIDSIAPALSNKYIWMSRGDLTGKAPKDTKKDEITRSRAGFIKAREPRNGSDQYDVIVAEGALKGIITAKYINVPDKNGESLADRIAGPNKGIIIAQVPGVAESFVETVDRIYNVANVDKTYIAMDADGRENLNVAIGIHAAEDTLKKFTPTAVMSWNPEQKGIDDALLAVASGKITMDDLDLKFGTADELFPLDQAKPQIPYNIKGQKAYDNKSMPAWVVEWLDDKKAQDEKFDEVEAQSHGKVDLGVEDKNDQEAEQSKPEAKQEAKQEAQQPKEEAKQPETKQEVQEPEAKQPETAKPEAQQSKEEIATAEAKRLSEAKQKTEAKQPEAKQPATAMSDADLEKLIRQSMKAREEDMIKDVEEEIKLNLKGLNLEVENQSKSSGMKL